MLEPLDNVKQLLRKASTISVNDAYVLKARVTSIDDPLRLGRCKVEIFSDGSLSYASDWCETTHNRVSNGLLPNSLVGQFVVVFPVKNSYEQMVVSIPKPLAYLTNEELPSASVENLGLRLVLLGNSEAFETVCLLRNGTFVWEKLCPLTHGHGGGHTQNQQRDSGGDLQMPVDQLPINDEVFSTSVLAYTKDGGLPPILT
jgi:hypothetical protein